MNPLLDRLLPQLHDLAIAHGISAAFFMVVAGLLFIPVEGFFPLRRPASVEKGRRRIERGADVLHAVINPTVGALTGALLGLVLNERFLRRALRRAFDVEVPAVVRWHLQLAHDLSPSAHFVGALLLAAFAGYAVHRALHSWSWLWRFHAVHHCSERVDWLSAHRQHPVEVMLIVAATVVPTLAVGLRPEAIASVIVFRRLHLFFSHAATRVPVGPFSYLLVTPQHHHWHHEVDARCNYAGLFPWIDRLFGTHRAAATFPEQTGIGGHVHRGYVAHLLHPLRRERLDCDCRTSRATRRESPEQQGQPGSGCPDEPSGGLLLDPVG